MYLDGNCLVRNIYRGIAGEVDLVSVIDRGDGRFAEDGRYLFREGDTESGRGRLNIVEWIAATWCVSEVALELVIPPLRVRRTDA